MSNIVDADAHVIECEDTWNYLGPSDEKFRPIPVADPSGGHSSWLVDGQIIPSAVGDKSIRKDVKELRDVPGRLERMDGFGIDKQVLYPTFFIGLTGARPEVHTALARTYNRWMADVYSRSQGRLPWVAVPSLLDIDESIAQIEFGASNGAHGVFMRGVEGDRTLADPYFFPLYEKAEELGLPITIHAGTGNKDVRSIFYGQAETRVRDVFAAANIPVLAAFHLLSISGVPEMFPGLRFGFIEAGAQWVPFIVGEIARREETMNAETGVDDPSKLLESKRFFVACRTDNDIAGIVEEFGSKNFVMGTDYGHEDAGTEVEAFANLRAQGAIAEEDLDRIMTENAKGLFKL